MCRFPDGDKDSDGPSESGDNTSESTQGPPSEPAQEKGMKTMKETRPNKNHYITHITPIYLFMFIC